MELMSGAFSFYCDFLLYIISVPTAEQTSHLQHFGHHSNLVSIRAGNLGIPREQVRCQTPFGENDVITEFKKAA